MYFKKRQTIVFRKTYVLLWGELLNFKIFFEYLSLISRFVYMLRNSIIPAFIVLLLIICNACNKENIFNGESANLRFSHDTLSFDTVFTTVGSATRFIKIYNPNQEDVIIDKIYLEEGNSSFFNLNINGISANSAEEIKVLGRDSIYIFAEVTVDPDQDVSVSPFVITENLIVDYKSENYAVVLEAWGQNANYFPGKDAQGALPRIFTCDMGQFSFDDPKPYVVHGVLVIDSCELVLPKGTNIYVHGGIAINDLGTYPDGRIIIGPDAKIIAQGTAEEPVTLQGDRLEMEYDNIPGQWVGLIILPGSTGNRLSHTLIKNTVVGVVADSASTLNLNSVEIANTSSSALVGVHSRIIGNNCLVYNNGSSSAQLSYGGTYNFTNCTFYNDINDMSAIYLNNYQCIDPQCVDPPRINKMDARFVNCIISGTGIDEIQLDDWNDGTQDELFEFFFDHCLMKVEEILLPEQYPDLLSNSPGSESIMNNDSIFLDRENFDLRHDTMSIAIDKGTFVFTLPEDIRGLPRDNIFDLGCYEFQK